MKCQLNNSMGRETLKVFTQDQIMQLIKSTNLGDYIHVLILISNNVNFELWSIIRGKHILPILLRNSSNYSHYHYLENMFDGCLPHRDLLQCMICFIEISAGFVTPAYSATIGQALLTN